MVSTARPVPAARPARRRRWLWGAVGAAALLAVFWLYTRPDFLFTLANQAWACF